MRTTNFKEARALPSKRIGGVEPTSGADDLTIGSPLLVGIFSKQIEPVRLAEIHGEHSLVSDIETVLNRPPFPLPPLKCLPPEVVRSVLESMPLLVMKEQDEVVCVGNIRLYRLANYALAPQEFVPTRQLAATLTNNGSDNLKNSLLAEAFLLPAIFGRRPAELRALKLAWQRAAEAKHLGFWPGVDSYSELCRETRAGRGRKRAHGRG